MAVFRVEKNKNYTNMSNYHFRDKSLSWKAKGILSNMLSLPDDWDYSLAGLATLSSDGMTATRSAIKELEEHGYLIRRPIRKDGKISDWEYIIFECPEMKNLHNGKPALDNQVVGEQDVENQHIENNTQLNTNTSNTKEKNINIQNTKDNILIEFETLWKSYPRKVGKPKALKAYQKARKNGTTFEDVEQGIKKYCKQIEIKKTETSYIKHGSTWFSGECWNDEYDTGEMNSGTANGNNESEPPINTGTWL